MDSRDSKILPFNSLRSRFDKVARKDCTENFNSILEFLTNSRCKDETSVFETMIDSIMNSILLALNFYNSREQKSIIVFALAA